MFRNIENKEQQRRELKKLYNTPENLRLKYIALGVISVGIILMLVMIFRIDYISRQAMLFMQGFAGLCAIAFVVLVGILVYRVNNSYIQQQSNPKGDRRHQ